MLDKGRWNFVALYAVAMAWVEAAVVFYLRTIANQPDPYQPSLVAFQPALLRAEMVREAATLIMLLAVGWLAGRTLRSRLGYLLVAFGLWDIFYYVFLTIITGWPRSLWDWDILFLLPLPWWGPVWSPMAIATLMVAGGTAMTWHERAALKLWPKPWTWAANLCGMGLALWVFMADALSAPGRGYEDVMTVRPVWFNWPLFILALCLMAVPVLEISWRWWALVKRRAMPDYAGSREGT
jgi:hypothetical protein